MLRVCTVTLLRQATQNLQGYLLSVSLCRLVALHPQNKEANLEQGSNRYKSNHPISIMLCIRRITKVQVPKLRRNQLLLYYNCLKLIVPSIFNCDVDHSAESKCDIVIIYVLHRFTYLKIPRITWGSKVHFCMTSVDLTSWQLWYIYPIQGSQISQQTLQNMSLFSTKPGQLSFKLPASGGRSNRHLCWGPTVAGASAWRGVQPDELLIQDL